MCVFTSSTLLLSTKLKYARWIKFQGFSRCNVESHIYEGDGGSLKILIQHHRLAQALSAIFQSHEQTTQHQANQQNRSYHFVTYIPKPSSKILSAKYPLFTRFPFRFPFGFPCAFSLSH